jgi:hypothetical protein
MVIGVSLAVLLVFDNIQELKEIKKNKKINETTFIANDEISRSVFMSVALDYYLQQIKIVNSL